MSNTPKIDEILTRLDEYNLNADASSNITFSVGEIYAHFPDLAHAKDQLYQLILEVIGEDEPPHDIHLMDKNTAIFLNNKIAFCNGLRAEQRQKLNNLFGEEE